MKNNILKYVLILGKNCNMQCIYCFQGDDIPNSQGGCTSQNLYSKELTPKEAVKIFPKTGSYELLLYGGEPLLYWDYLIDFAYHIRKRNSSVFLRVISNLTLLTVKKAKRLNELGVHVSASHDGNKFEITRRRPDFLKINPGPYLALNSRNISAVYSSLNPDFYDIWEYFDNFIAMHGLPRKELIAIRALRDINGTTPQELFIYNDLDYENMLDRVFDKLYLDLKNNVKMEDSYEISNYYYAMLAIRRRVNQPDIDFGPWCGADSTTVKVDTYGNLFSCVNLNESFANFKDVGIKVGPLSPYRNSPECGNCMAYIYCGGSCFTASQEARKYICYTTYQEISRLINVIIKLGGK
jgi:radical SAM protein with 4Fe4S-binding SPASM domain